MPHPRHRPRRRRGRPSILVEADHTHPDAVGLALTLTQAWELIGDLLALVAHHPAPTMPTLATDTTPRTP